MERPFKNFSTPQAETYCPSNSRNRDLSACSRGLLPARENHSDSAAVLIVCVVSGAFTVTSIVRLGAFFPLGEPSSQGPPAS